MAWTINPLSQYNGFFRLATQKTLCGIDQLVGLHLNHEFNNAYWAETIQMDDAELLKRIRWYDKTGSPTSVQMLQNAKARLKKKGFIDYKNLQKGMTEYRLIKLYDDDPYATPTSTPTPTPTASEKSHINACAENLKTKTKTKARYSAHAKGGETNGRRPYSLPPEDDGSEPWNNC